MIDYSMDDDYKKLVRACIKKEAIDEGMEMILELLMEYNIHNDERITNVITHLAYISIGDEED